MELTIGQRKKHLVTAISNLSSQMNPIDREKYKVEVYVDPLGVREFRKVKPARICEIIAAKPNRLVVGCSSVLFLPDRVAPLQKRNTNEGDDRGPMWSPQR